MSSTRPTLATRREFCRYGAAIAAVLAVPEAARATPFTRRPALALVEQRAEGSADFAGGAAASDVRVIAVQADVGAAWMNEIEPLWRSALVPIAGYTHAGALFCLELFARSYGGAVVHRTRHARDAAGGWAHSAAGYDALRVAAALDAAGHAWPRAAGDLCAAAVPAAAVPVELLEPTLEARSTAVEPVYSWVIGPRVREHA